jgi:hypothetical protein
VSTLRSLLLRRSNLVSCMETLLDKQAQDSNRRWLILQRSKQAWLLLEKADRAEALVREVKASNECLAKENQARQASIQAQGQQLRVNFALGGPHEASKLVHDLRYLSHSFSSVEAILLKEQSLIASQILSMFSIRLENQESNIYSTLGLILPTNISQLMTKAQPKEATNAALGYFTLLLDIVGFYFGGVQLSESVFQASRSVVYSTSDFWNRKPESSDSIQPLYIDDDGASKGLEKGTLSLIDPESDLAFAFSLLMRSGYCLSTDLLKVDAYFSCPIQKIQAFLFSFNDELPDLSQPQYAQGPPQLALLQSSHTPLRIEHDLDMNDWVKL